MLRPLRFIVSSARGHGVLVAPPDTRAQVLADLAVSPYAVVCAETPHSAVRAGRKDHQARIAEALHLPAVAGRNLDAMADTLWDLPELWPAEQGLALVWPGAGDLARADPAAWQMLADVLREASGRLAPDWAFETVALIDLPHRSAHGQDGGLVAPEFREDT